MAGNREPEGCFVFDASVLARLVGLQGGLRPTIRAESKRVIRALEQSIDTLEITVVGHEGGILQVESADARVLGLDHRAVVVDIPLDGEDVQLEGSLELLRPSPPYRVALHPVATPDTLQRRNWVRVPTKVAARMAGAEEPRGSERWIATTTRDLSPGGTCVTTVGEVEPGQRVRLELRLATGQIEVEGVVLAVMDDGTTRIRFEGVAEEDVQRLLRHHVDLESARGYPYASY
ncbi:MAG TPA: PilZ domain-containing protein [Acidimicrobiales bacterium]|nr:PilZ domain-containing protein [Acidimicrobiales bacterium]